MNPKFLVRIQNLPAPGNRNATEPFDTRLIKKPGRNSILGVVRIEVPALPEHRIEDSSISLILESSTDGETFFEVHSMEILPTAGGFTGGNYEIDIPGDIARFFRFQQISRRGALTGEKEIKYTLSLHEASNEAVLRASSELEEKHRLFEAEKSQLEREAGICSQYLTNQERLKQSREALIGLGERLESASVFNYAAAAYQLETAGPIPVLIDAIGKNLASAAALAAHSKDIIAAFKTRTVDIEEKRVSEFIAANAVVLKKHGVLK